MSVLLLIFVLFVPTNLSYFVSICQDASVSAVTVLYLSCLLLADLFGL